MPPKEAGTTDDGFTWDVSNVLDTINLGIVLIIFYHGVVSNRREKREQGRRDVALFWIQELILSPNVEMLHAFFDKWEQELKDAAAETRPTKKKAQDRIIRFKEDWHDVRQKVVDPLRMVSSHFDELGELLGEIEESATNEFQKIQGVAEEKTSTSGADVMRRLRVSFFQAIHRGELAFVDGCQSQAGGSRGSRCVSTA